MIAGIPGVGINGVFYLLLALLMPVREAWRTVTGRSSVARWRFVLTQTATAAGVLLALAAEYWLITRGLDFLHRQAAPNTVVAAITAADPQAVAPGIAMAPFIALGAVMLSVQALRLVLPARHLAPVSPHGTAAPAPDTTAEPGATAP